MSPSSRTIFAGEFAVAPKAEAVAVGIDEVGQGLELAPLRLVVRVGEFARVAALARRLDLDEADKRVVDADRVIRPRLQMRERRFADERQAARREVVERREFVEKPLKRRPKLIFRGAGNGGIVQLGLGFGAEGRDDVRKCRFCNERSESIEDRLFGAYRWCRQGAWTRRVRDTSSGSAMGPPLARRRRLSTPRPLLRRLRPDRNIIQHRGEPALDLGHVHALPGGASRPGRVRPWPRRNVRLRMRDIDARHGRAGHMAKLSVSLTPIARSASSRRNSVAFSVWSGWAG